MAIDRITIKTCKKKIMDVSSLQYQVTSYLINLYAYMKIIAFQYLESICIH